MYNRTKSISHPNLPQMVGFSDENSATPFIIMEKGNNDLSADSIQLIQMFVVQLRDMNAFMKKAMLSQDLAACATHMLRMVNISSLPALDTRW